MDPLKRGDYKLRRFCRASNLPSNTHVRSILDQSRQDSLRHTIREKMFSFVLPTGSIGDSHVECTHALLEVVAHNEFAAHFKLYARIKAKTNAPLIVAFGFSFYAGGRFAVGTPGLNYPGLDQQQTIVCLSGVSHWLANHLVGAFDQGVNFRIHSSTNLHGNLRDFLFEFLRKLDGPPFRIMGWFDEDGERDYSAADVAIAGMGYTNIFQEAGLQVDLTYPIDLVYDTFFS